MRILVTGDRGYLGSVVRSVLADHVSVIGCDAGWFDPQEFMPPVRDFRDLSVHDLDSIDVVVHLAAVCNDACGDISAAATDDVNHLSSVKFARAAREAGVKLFVFASSCSVYGSAGDVQADERYIPTPLTVYSASKLAAEGNILALAGTEFNPVAVRLATLYGYSPSFRSDLMINRMVSSAWRDGSIYVSGKGTALRPMLHVADAAEAIAAIVEAGRCDGASLFNIGAAGENFRVTDIARLVAEAFPEARVEAVGSDDARSYSVDFTRFNTTYPAWQPRRRPADAVREVASALRTGRIPQLASGESGWGATDRKERLLSLVRRSLLDDWFRRTDPSSTPDYGVH